MRTFGFKTILFVTLIFGAAGILFAGEADPSRGDKILKAMSSKLAAAKLFSFSTREFHDVTKRNGERVKLNITRDVMVRRPNGFWTKYAGDRDWEFWYDGKMLTGISNEKKIYVQHEMPPTIDASMDMLAQRLNLDLPMSDVLYSSPYDAFMDAKTKGGFAGKESIDGSSCNHLSYSAEAVDWQLWIDEKSSVPCRLEMTYKQQPGKPFYRITFSNWNFSPKTNEDAFSSKIPEGYVRIPILERVLLQRGGSAQSQTNPTSSNP
jgi:hypothetical protein